MAFDQRNVFLEYFHQHKRPFSWYILGSFVIMVFSFIGQFPMLFFLPPKIYSSDLNALFGHLDKNLTLLLLLIPFVTAFLGFLLVVYKLHGQTLISVTTGRSKIDWNRIGFGFCFWAVLTLFLFGVDYIINPSDYQWNFEWQTFLTLIVLSALLIPIQSGLEEWIFRGYLMQGFSRIIHYRWFPLLMTSLLFGCLHLFNPEIDKIGEGLLFYYIGTGFFFGIIALMDEGIELTLGFHTANNFITSLLVTADWTVFQTPSLFLDNSEPSLLSELFIFLGLVYPLTLWLLAKKYNWKDWKYKLSARIYENETHL